VSGGGGGEGSPLVGAFALVWVCRGAGASRKRWDVPYKEMSVLCMQHVCLVDGDCKAAAVSPAPRPCLLQEAKALQEQQGVPYSDMAVLFRAFNCNGAKAHTQLQVSTLCPCAQNLRHMQPPFGDDNVLWPSPLILVADTYSGSVTLAAGNRVHSNTPSYGRESCLFQTVQPAQGVGHPTLHSKRAAVDHLPCVCQHRLG
jgi:hypothetical protein